MSAGQGIDATRIAAGSISREKVAQGTVPRAVRLAATITVLVAGAFSVGHYIGGAGMAADASDCRAAVHASLDDWQGVEGAGIRFEEYAGRCIN